MQYWKLLGTAVAAGSMLGVALPSIAAQRAQVAQMEESPKPQEPTKAAKSTRTVTKTATIVAIDPDEGKLALKTEDGQTIPLQVGDQVKNLHNLKVGDRIQAEYQESLVLALNRPGSGVSEVEREQVAGREEGTVSAAERITATVRIEEIDKRKNEVTFVGPTGTEHRIQVQEPQMQKLLGNLNQGDTVDITYTHGLALSLQPMSK